MFEYKHRCPFCTMYSDANTDHDHYLTCTFTRSSKNKRLTSFSLKLNKLHTLPFLHDTIINIIDRFYNDGLVDDIPASCSTSYNHIDIIHYTRLQQRIDWGHFIRGRISTSFHSLINAYFCSNQLGKRFTSSSWFRSIIPFLWNLHHKAWIDYCNTIHSPDTTTRKITTAKSTLLKLVDKYILEATILPIYKKLVFSCKASNYQLWSITELQKWLSTVRGILRRYRDRNIITKRTDIPVPTHQLNINQLQPYQYTVHRPLNNNYYKVSKVTIFYPLTYPNIIPTSTNFDI